MNPILLSGPLGWLRRTAMDANSLSRPPQVDNRIPGFTWGPMGPIPDQSTAEGIGVTRNLHDARDDLKNAIGALATLRMEVPQEKQIDPRGAALAGGVALLGRLFGASHEGTMGAYGSYLGGTQQRLDQENEQARRQAEADFQNRKMELEGGLSQAKLGLDFAGQDVDWFRESEKAKADAMLKSDLERKQEARAIRAELPNVKTRAEAIALLKRLSGLDVVTTEEALAYIIVGEKAEYIQRLDVEGKKGQIALTGERITGERITNALNELTFDYKLEESKYGAEMAGHKAREAESNANVAVATEDDRIASEKARSSMDVTREKYFGRMLAAQIGAYERSNRGGSGGSGGSGDKPTTATDRKRVDQIIVKLENQRDKYAAMPPDTVVGYDRDGYRIYAKDKAGAALTEIRRFYNELQMMADRDAKATGRKFTKGTSMDDPEFRRRLREYAATGEIR